MNKLYIRTDGNSILGLGHLMRCMSIGDALYESGKICEFIVADEEAACVVEERGYKAHVLDSKWNDLEYEIDLMIDFMREYNVELLLVDSYYATENYFEKLRPFTKLVYMTGKNTTVYAVDALIDYTISSEEKGYKNLYKDTAAKLFLGVQYAPLRKQFEIPWRFCDEAGDILLITGGTDAKGFSVELLEQIEKIEPALLKCRWHIVVGKFYSEEVKEKLQKYSSCKNICIYENVADMAELMQKCNIAVSAAGSTLYELCACGIPTVAFSFVDNQMRDLKAFGEKGYVFSVGDIRERMQECIEKTIVYLVQLKADDNLRRLQAQKMKAYIDGKGAKRLAECLRGEF